MQRIERYGVIALVFLLVTIVAVSLWGEQRKTGGLFHFLRRDSKSAQVDRLVAEAPQRELPAWDAARSGSQEDRTLPLSAELDGTPLPPATSAPGPVTPSGAPDPLVKESQFQPEQPPLVGDISQPQPVVEQAAIIDPPLLPKPSTYTVQKGDTLGQIAQRELGSVKRLPDLLEANPKLDPRKLQPGQVIRLPVEGSEQQAPVAQQNLQLPPKAPPIPERKTAQEPVPQIAKQQQQVPAGRSYTVQRGDTLGQIATRELGSSKRMSEIVALNKGLDPNHLLVGRTLVLPAGEKPAAPTAVAKTDAKPEGKPEVVAQSTPARSKVR
jgi:nucleoid-associated protein YgaU